MIEDVRKRLIERDDLPRVAIEIPEWDGEVHHVRALTAGEVEELGEQVQKGSIIGMLARVVCRVLVNEIGERVFKDGDEKHIAAMNSGAVQRIFSKSQELSGLSDTEEDAGND